MAITDAELAASQQRRREAREDALTDCRRRYYEFNPGHFEGRYFKSTGYGCAIIACIGGDDSWAAYIGGCSFAREEDVLMFVAAHGSKLSEKDARHFFPFIEIGYRP